MTEDEVVGCITDSMEMSSSKLRETVKDTKAWRAAVLGVARVRHELATEQQPEQREMT